MNPPTANGRWKLLVRWLGGLTLLAYTLSRFVPCPIPRHHPVFTLDESWLQTLHLAFTQHLQFGHDLIFTFGPWGFLYAGSYPPTFVISVMAWATLSFIFWWCLWQLARHSWKSESLAWLWMLGYVGVAGLQVDQEIDVRLTAWALILLFLHFFTDDAACSVAKILLVASLGWLGLIKFTELLMAAGIVLVIAADDLLRRRRFPWIIAVFGLSVIFFWLAAGQHLSSFGPFLCNSWRITNGYTEAMMCGAGTELWDAGGFWLAAAAACAPVGWAAFVKYRRFGALPLIGLGLVLLVIFKHGFVRNDPEHEAEAVLALLLIAWMGLAAAGPLLQGRSGRARLLGWLMGMIVLTYVSLSIGRCVPGKGLFARLAETFDPRIALSPARWFHNANDLRTGYENHLAEIRDAYPLPELDGSVDVYPWDQVVIFAHGWRYAPRPVIQSYSAYTPELAGMNAAHLRSERAADNLLFTLRTLEGRFPSLDDGLSWPELLTRYDIRDTTGIFVLLKRSATPREYHLTQFKDIPVHFGESVMLPDTTNGPIWAELKIDKSILGSAVSTFYKPPVLLLTVSLHDGRHLGYQLVPGMVRSGFLLSPLIQNAPAFVSLASADGWSRLSGLEVTSVTVSADTQSHSTLCYQSPMRLRLYHLDYPRQDLKEMPAGSTTPPLPPPPPGPAR